MNHFSLLLTATTVLSLIIVGLSFITGIQLFRGKWHNDTNAPPLSRNDRRKQRFSNHINGCLAILLSLALIGLIISSTITPFLGSICLINFLIVITNQTNLLKRFTH